MSSPTEKYQRCQRWFDKCYPDYRNAGQLYQDIIGEYVAEHTRVLDLGCGHSSLAQQQISIAALTSGIDPGFLDLQANRSIRYPILGTAETLPFASESFDVILSQWVVEHLAQPARVFDEIARVLRPGGTAVVFTTNANNYVPLASRIVPEQVQSKLLQSLLGRPQQESFPTYYRANTYKALSKLTGQAGLTVERRIYSGNPFYLAFSPLLFLVALLFERITDLLPLQRLKLYLIAVIHKPTSHI